MADHYDEYSSVCRTIVNPIRQKLIKTIGRQTLNVSEIQKELGISMSNLSNHLSALYKVGVLSRKKEGNFIFYFLTEPEILDVLEHMKRVIISLSEKRNNQISEV